MKRIILAAALALTVASGCAAGDPAVPEPEGSTAVPSDGAAATSAPAPSTIASGSPTDAPDSTSEPSPSAPAAASRAHLAVATLTGETFDAAATEGRPVILWFWAPWCTICRAEAPDVIQVVGELESSGSDVTILGVPGRGEVREMEDFVADTGTAVLTHLVDTEGVLWRKYGVVYQPAFALLSPDGEVEVINGALGADGLREAAARLAGA